jgi:hypothetical protein
MIVMARGRPVGAKDKQPRKRRAVVLEPRRGNGTPLSHLLDVMRDESLPPHRRDRASILAAPFCHPKADIVAKKAAAEAEARTNHEGIEWAQLLRRH